MKFAEVLVKDQLILNSDILEEDENEEREAIEGLSLVDMMGPGTWAPGVPAFHGQEARSVLIGGAITEVVANTVISQMMQLQADSDSAPIRVFVNTIGGDAAAGFALYDWMRCLTMPVMAIAYGRCSSAGLPILMGGDLRLAAPRTRFFYHEVIYGVETSSSVEANDHTNNREWYQEEMEQILWQRTTMTKTQWKKYFAGKTSYHFGPDIALETGIIHDTLDEIEKKFIVEGTRYGKSRKRRKS